MPPRQKTSMQGGWRAIALSVCVHAAIIAAAVFGWFTWKHESPPVEALAVEGTVVDARELKGIDKLPPAPEPPPPELEPEPQPSEPVEDMGPPKPDPAEIERKQQAERQAAEKLAQQKQETEQREQQQRDRDAQELKEREDAERLEAQQKAAAQKAAADRAEAEKVAADKRAAEKKAADEKARLAREAELRQSLEAEERGNALRNSDAANRWHAQIVARIQRAWIRPPSAAAGIECIVAVTQVQGGEVTDVQVQSCNGGGDSMRQSVQDAVYRASPLPAPPDPSLFERNLLLTFRPT